MTTSPTTTTTSNNNNNSPGNSNRSNNQVHWAIIGLGDVCTIKSGPAFYKSHGSTLAAVMRRTPGKAREWIDENIREGNFPEEVKENIRGFESVESLMEWALRGGEDAGGGRGTIDVIYVATPPGAHLQVIRQIVSSIQNIRGDGENADGHPIQAVYVEKPVGRCAWETRAIIDELSQRPGMEDIVFYPAYVSRAHERTQVLRNLLGKDKVCGDCVTSVEYVMKGSGFARGLDGEGLPWRLNAELSGGGLIMDMGCHVLDRIDYLFGPIVDVQSTVSRKGASIGGSSEEYPLVEDYVSMNATIGPSDWSVIPSEGANVQCVWDFVPPEDRSKKNERDEFVIRGPKGSLRMGGMGAGLPIEFLDADGNVVKVIEFDPPKHSAQPLIQAVTNELRGVEKTSKDGSYELHRSPARADNAIRASKVLDAILNSYYGGRHDEFWSRSESWPGLKE
eukprot:CAMPEP_0171350892 /NCGR_PEP_ID=MMETSP0878-20121228/37549_1 /TAXON_ID=67004 /ORGANISM="Thalassiosira weissflogii, Strain CCMP1336" /LENGTH=449 /DNA_ID=CAMNT_0011855935 /DNA_START=342 /DNA_END=1691 /DNA_ORIENTATION=+